MSKKTDIERIHDCFKKGIELPNDLSERYKRLNAARELLFGTKMLKVPQIIKILTTNYKLTQVQARLDIVDAKKLFAFLDPIDRDFEKAWTIMSIKDNIARAIKKGDRKTVATENKNLITIFGFDKDQENAMPPTVNINVINFNPTLIGAHSRTNEELDDAVEKFLLSDQQELDDITEADWEEVIKTEEAND